METSTLKRELRALLLVWAFVVAAMTGVAVAGEDYIGAASTTGLLADAGVTAGAVTVPRGSLMSIQCAGTNPQDVNMMLAPEADAGYWDAGAAWLQEPKKMLPTSTRASQAGLLFRPVSPDGGSVTCKVFSRVGNE